MPEAKSAELWFSAAAVTIAVLTALRIIYLLKSVKMYGGFKKSLSEDGPPARAALYVKAAALICGVLMTAAGAALVFLGFALYGISAALCGGSFITAYLLLARVSRFSV